MFLLWWHEFVRRWQSCARKWFDFIWEWHFLLFGNEWVLFRNELGRFASNLEMTGGCLEVSRLYSKNGLLLCGNFTMPFRYKLVRFRIGSLLSDLVFDCRCLVFGCWVLALAFYSLYFVFLFQIPGFQIPGCFPIFYVLSFGLRLLDCWFWVFGFSFLIV